MTDVKNAPNGHGVEPAWDQSRPVWDETRPAGTSGLFSGISGADLLLFGVVAAVALAIGVVNALSLAQDAAWRGGAYDLRRPLLWEMSSVATIILVSPVLFVAVRRLRQTSSWSGRIALAAGATVAFSALHIAGMVGIRKLLLLMIGGSYDFRFSLAAVVYEFRKDVVTCLMIGGMLFLIESWRQMRQARAATLAEPARARLHTVWLRDGTTRIRIEPREIVWITSAGNYVEYSLDGGITHLVRGTLAAAEAELARFNVARVHRTRLANLDRVTGLELKASGDFELTFDTGHTIQGSRRYRDAIASLERDTRQAE